MEDEKIKICIFKTASFESHYEVISSHIPIGDFIEVSLDDYERYISYIDWNNRQSNTDWLTMVRLGDVQHFSWDAFEKDIAAQKKKTEEAAAKRKMAAKKRADNKKQKELDQLKKLKDKYE